MKWSVACCLSWFAMGAWAHGSVSMDEDMCKLRVGKYVMHFAGYQPDTPSGPKEFCEDIPEAANTIIVLDYLNDELRDMPTEVRIIRATSSGERNLGEDTVFLLPARKYISGSLSLETKLDAGDYVGMVTVGDQDKLVARFPFSVGRRGYGWQIWSALLVAGAAALYYFGMRQRRRYKVAS